MASQVPAGVPVDREQVDFLSSCSSLLVCHFFPHCVEDCCIEEEEEEESVLTQ
jgi:hypothetical protein